MTKEKKRVGVFAGSFDPFTIGHDDIVHRALQVVDELHVLIGVNYLKTSFQTPMERLTTIRELYSDEPRIVVATNEGLTAHYAKEVGACFLIRSLRTVKDMEYEREVAHTNLAHFGLDTIFFFSDPALSSVSSSVARELAAFGEDISAYIPQKK